MMRVFAAIYRLYKRLTTLKTKKETQEAPPRQSSAPPRQSSVHPERDHDSDNDDDWGQFVAIDDSV